MANTSIKYLKDENGQKFSPIVNIKGIYDDNGNSLLDLFYPIGSYYETSSESFDPNESWGGTWKEDTMGVVTVGSIRTVADAVNGNMIKGGLAILVGNITGEVEHTLTIDEMPSHRHTLTSWKYYGNDPQNGGKIAKTYDEADYNASSESPITRTGGSQPHNNIQPSIGVYRWHRIA